MEPHRMNISPRTLSSIGGVLYLFIIVLGLFEEAFVRSRIIVSGDAATTAARARAPFRRLLAKGVNVEKWKLRATAQQSAQPSR
jgi:hypothetical protein